jgi:cysteinyl-tRNA synthetase
MPKKRLRESLDVLHDELKNTSTVDEDLRQDLMTVMDDINQLIDEEDDARTSSPTTLADRLRDNLERFEESHPLLANSVRKVMESLSATGI